MLPVLLSSRSERTQPNMRFELPQTRLRDALEFLGPSRIPASATDFRALHETILD
jgi:hypothetical protein